MAKKDGEREREIKIGQDSRKSTGSGIRVRKRENENENAKECENNNQTVNLSRKYRSIDRMDWTGQCRIDRPYAIATDHCTALHCTARCVQYSHASRQQMTMEICYKHHNTVSKWQHRPLHSIDVENEKKIRLLKMATTRPTMRLQQQQPKKNQRKQDRKNAGSLIDCHL